MINTFKIINDPVHGFINIPSGTVQEIIEHPYFQRLRDIEQLGFTNLVYPGATHSRLSHALGAMHLMQEAIAVLRLKGIEVTECEEEASLSAILLHDVGHGPFSHALENNIICGVSHEEISLALMREINRNLGGKLEMAISVFEGSYHKRFLHQLVSGQLDVDRLDYLKRDSFFSGVAEGMIGLERIIKMMSVASNNLVIEEKGIYSVEKFLISRRLMYWQVYLHKTVIAAEQLLMSIFKRARILAKRGDNLPGSPAICYFLSGDFTPESFETPEVLEMFTRLDDTDVMSAIKQWQFCDDSILAPLCIMLTERKLPKLILSVSPFDSGEFNGAAKLFRDEYRVRYKRDISDEAISYFVNMGEVFNKGYDSAEGEIKILTKEGKTHDVYRISDMLSAKAFSQITKKHFLCRAKLIS